ncbi:HD domain-containing protein [Candidatus Marsarchaeota archaeon]|nr:HD domain-containing protein [Candidatus Marsarchaeota archaeon]
MHIRDAILGSIELSDAELKIIDTKYMQRLRFIKQLGFSYLVYPGANNTRFEHSLGTMQITKEITKNIFNEDIEELYCAALLHDIGHAPFSHQSDFALKKYLNKTHEDISIDMIKKTEIKDIISNSTMSLSKVLNFLKGKTKGNIISSSIGSDRIDYLMRDSRYTGVAYGVIDYNRIKSKLAMFKNTLAVFEGGITGVESMLLARYFMFSSVYLHHTTLIADQMFRKAYDTALENKQIDINLLTTGTDDQVFNLLLNLPNSELIKKIKERKLFKRVFSSEFDKRKLKINIQEIINAIENLNISNNDYVISFSEYKPEKEDIYVLDRNKKLLGNLDSVSPLIKALEGIFENKIRLLVACNPKYTKRINKALNKIMYQK